MPETEDVERAIDELFVSPPEVFTEARNALAKRLKEEGDAEGARRVGALRRPVRSARAVNRLVHEAGSAAEELLTVGERLRLAQRRALSGGGADELRERSEERRKLVIEIASADEDAARPGRGAYPGGDRGDRRYVRGRLGQ